jgi:hypothetical protein
MKYQLLVNSTSELLSENVNKHLEAGWELYGSPSIAMSVSDYAEHYEYAQAVIKKGETDAK